MSEALTEQKSQKWAISLFTIGVFMAALDNGIISAALTTINESFSVSLPGDHGALPFIRSVLASVCQSSENFPTATAEKLFLIEVCLFGLGSLLVALSQSFPLFLISRLIQALGGGGIFIIGSSHILATLPKENRGRRLGCLAQ